MLSNWLLLHNIKNILSEWGLRVHLCSSLGILIALIMWLCLT